eukprot:6838215-Ditylum_brightwellii.AAC.1
MPQTVSATMTTELSLSVTGKRMEHINVSVTKKREKDIMPHVHNYNFNSESHDNSYSSNTNDGTKPACSAQCGSSSALEKFNLNQPQKKEDKIDNNLHVNATINKHDDKHHPIPDSFSN